MSDRSSIFIRRNRGRRRTYHVLDLLEDERRYRPREIHLLANGWCVEVTIETVLRLYGLHTESTERNTSPVRFTMPRAGIGILVPNPEYKRRSL